MSPREFTRHFVADDRLRSGRYFSEAPLKIARGDKIGVVLLNEGGPQDSDDIAPFLYRMFMDPAVADLPGGRWMRHNMSRMVAAAGARALAKDYEAIGGRSPMNQLTQEQAISLETLLNVEYGAAHGVTFHTYIAMRYGLTNAEKAAAQMQQDGIDKVILLPLHPHYSIAATGSFLHYWWTLTRTQEIPTWPTTQVTEYAIHPKYVQALSERIDEAMQRYARHVRPKVHLLFSASGPSNQRGRPDEVYRSLVEATIDKLMAYRSDDRQHHVVFQDKVEPLPWLATGTSEKLVQLAEDRHTAVLLVPITYVTDRLETVHRLDVHLRAVARERGIRHYEVTSGLNCHPLFLETLLEATRAQLQLENPGSGIQASGDGKQHAGNRPSRSSETAAHRPLKSASRSEARHWVPAEYTSILRPDTGLRPLPPALS